jgi:hypothetical protein
VVAQFMSGVESVKSTGHFMPVAQGYVILRMAPGMEKWWMLSVMSAKRKSGEPMLSDSADGYVMKIRRDSETEAFIGGYVYGRYRFCGGLVCVGCRCDLFGVGCGVCGCVHC